mmetsp:Transcript_22477/g.70794  ORF Transcript_22477/g.70794 Transcript_22477/m.70794 type:complete len:390 (+) Transcript_22477:85-1254(+)
MAGDAAGAALVGGTVVLQPSEATPGSACRGPAEAAEQPARARTAREPEAVDQLAALAFGSAGEVDRASGAGTSGGLHVEDVQRTVLTTGRATGQIAGVPCGHIVAPVGFDRLLPQSGTIAALEDARSFADLRYSVSPMVKVAVVPRGGEDLPKLAEGLRELSKSDPLVACDTSRPPPGSLLSATPQPAGDVEEAEAAAGQPALAGAGAAPRAERGAEAGMAARGGMRAGGMQEASEAHGLEVEEGELAGGLDDPFDPVAGARAPLRVEPFVPVRGRKAKKKRSVARPGLAPEAAGGPPECRHPLGPGALAAAARPPGCGDEQHTAELGAGTKSEKDLRAELEEACAETAGLERRLAAAEARVAARSCAARGLLAGRAVQTAGSAACARP